MKCIWYLFVFLFVNSYIYPENFAKQNLAAQADKIEADKNFKPLLNLGILFEIPSSELDQVKNGNTGAILSDLIKMIEQEIIIITSSVLLNYLQILFSKTGEYKIIQAKLNEYELYQTYENNFTVMLPKSRLADWSIDRFNKNLKKTDFGQLHIQLNSEINLEEFKSIFKENEDTDKYIYLTGHGTPITWNNQPLIAYLSLNKYRELITFLDKINCKFLFVSSCYAAGLNMITAHSNLQHKFSIALGNLTDSFSNFNVKINFKKFFTSIKKALQTIITERDYLYSNDFRKAISYICGNFVNNIPWIKLADSEKFFILPISNSVLNYSDLSKNHYDALRDSENLFLSKPKLEIVKILDEKLNKIISMIPGKAYHVIECVQAEKYTLYEIINSILAVSYEFPKVFFFKNIRIKKAKKKSNKFKMLNIKNLLVINRSIQLNDIENFHEVYYQKDSNYLKITIPAGIKLGYLTISPELLKLKTKRFIIKNFLKLAEPSQQVLKSL